eukprot:TRINITY_DN40651_c0_g1_i1.p1 TRINITY_DN40651_c0_g1~~TRINITY_DN40651_c0_g1_i1.p1  ORF type:complete len:159 (+),score=22.22 TRINITY_DN40651_c0_g1_i1:139-615(+)
MASAIVSTPSASTAFAGVRPCYWTTTKKIAPLQNTFVRIGNARPFNVIVMSKQKEELKEIRAKSTEEIEDQIVDLKGELFMLNMQKSTKGSVSRAETTRIKKRIARMLTVRRQRELEQGINKRQSRKTEREWRISVVPKPPLSLIKRQQEEAGKTDEK